MPVADIERIPPRQIRERLIERVIEAELRCPWLAERLRDAHDPVRVWTGSIRQDALASTGATHVGGDSAS